ncbi:MAG: DUF1302 family protein [Paludibacteraceae bacterium]|nr:DUF1302 family protein [Paludibacteraceae bacterium]
MKHVIFTALLLCILPRPVAAQDEESLHVGVKGFVDTYHAMRTEKPNDWMSSRSRVRGEVSIDKGHAGAFVSANLVYNAILKDRTGFQLRETYAYYANSYWDIRAGRQIITWGVADALRLTDIISPMDYTEFLAQDYDDIRIPVGALRLRYSREKWSLEAVAVPVCSFFELPTEEENPWSIGELTIGKEPKHKLYNMEYGGRLSFFLSGIDFSFSALHTWNKTPVFHNAIGEYHRMTMLGADMSVPINKFVVRGEFAEYLNEAQQTIGAEKIARASSTNALIGLDWYAGNDWSLSAQYAHKYVAYGEHNNSGLATFRISKDLFNNTLNLQSFAYLDVENGGVYNRLSADYALNDQLHTLIGYDFFHADKGTFSVYDKNSEVWIKLKYSF